MQPIDTSRALDNLEGLAWALDCVVFSIDIRGRAVEDRDGLAACAITDAMFDQINQLRADCSKAKDVPAVKVVTADTITENRYSFGNN